MDTAGANAGISGLIDLPNVGGTTAKFRCRIFFASEELNASEINNAGRGDNDFPEQVFLASDGLILLTGIEIAREFTLPDNWIGEVGTVAAQLSPEHTRSFPIKVKGWKNKRDEKKENLVTLSLTCRITGMPTLTIAGKTVPSAGNPNGSTKALWEGATKRIDAGPNNLIGSGAQVWSVWGVTDTDAAEVNAIAAVISDYVASVSGLKIKYAEHRRLSARLIRITLSESLTDSTDDVNILATDIFVDPNKLGNHATISQVNSTASVPEDMVEEGVSSKPLPGGNTQNILVAGRQYSYEKVEQPTTAQHVDSLGVDVYQTITKTYLRASGVPADNTISLGTNQVIHHRVIEPVDHFNDKITWFVTGVTTEQELELPQTKNVVDTASNPLNSQRFVAKMAALTTPGVPGIYNSTPADPTPPSGFKIVEHTDIVAAQNAGLGVRLWHMATLDSNDEKIFERRKTDTDPNAINTRQADAAVFATGSPPSDPSLPSGLKLVSKTDIPLNITYSLRVYEWAKRDSKDEIELGSPNSSHRMGGTFAQYSPEQTRQISAVTVESCNATDTAQTLALARFISVATSSTGDKSTLAIIAKKLNDTQAIYTKVLGPNLKIVVGHTIGGYEKVTATYQGGVVKVWCADLVARGSFDEVLIAPQTIWRERTRIRIIKRIMTDSSGNFDRMASYLGTSNAASFFGFGIATVAYRGCDFKYNSELFDLLGGGAKQMPITVGFNLEGRSDGAIDEAGVTMGRFKVATGTVTKNAWNDVSLLGWSAALLPTADYTTFLA